MSREQEYKDMFYAEAFENHEELNTLFTKLEKNHKDKKTIDSIFRITHTLKGNAMGLGFKEIAELGHVMEDVFSEVKEGNIELDDELFTNLFKANDKLGALISALKTPKKVSYKGIRTKLEVFIKKARDFGTDEVEGEIEEENIAQKDNFENKLEDELVIEVELLNEEEEDEEEDDENTKISFSDQVQIPVHKLDSLMNLVGELIIEKDSLVAQSISKGGRGGELARLHRITSDLQYGVMGVRMVQVGFMFNKFHRILRDVASIEEKNINLHLEGTEIEIDRNILKIMSDSLVHLVRNAASHGIEDLAERKLAGKSEEGNVTLTAINEKDTVIIKVTDDGAGINPEAIKKKAISTGLISPEFAKQLSDQDVYMLIFEPGFSNAEAITEVSGRGVGMDVVKRATESIGGNISVNTKLGKGTTITLSLPSSMAVKGALLFEMGEQEYAVPLAYTEAVISLKKRDIHKINTGLMATYLDKTISIVFLDDMFNVKKIEEIREQGVLHQTFDKLENNEDKLDVLVASFGDKNVGFVVDKLLQQKEIVEKTLSQPIDHIELFSGATIMGNGNVCLVLDVASILRELFKERLTTV